ncbi:Tetraspanin-2 [Sesamum angolense]|uniref:Tetraspanin-2 n=1 Tax=Sesamum angolense TaxID=2727404 RepID=A0AAE1WEQ5_9LAMI|nr:Tetraspanin-2 [Sesamum angolense]
MCGFQYSSPTTWVGPSNIAAEADCTIWNNDPSQLCYNCDSCKAGLLGNLRHEWRKANIILIRTVVVLIWVYLIACSAYRNAQTEELFRSQLNTNTSYPSAVSPMFMDDSDVLAF